MFILDTNVISEAMRVTPNTRVVNWLDQQSLSALYLTTITVAEIRAGIAVMPSGRKKEALSAAFETQILPDFLGRILPFDEPATRCYASIRHSARAAGRAIADFDALIASIALTRGFTVVTRDVSPFEAVEVRTIDPFESNRADSFRSAP